MYSRCRKFAQIRDMLEVHKSSVTSRDMDLSVVKHNFVSCRLEVRDIQTTNKIETQQTHRVLMCQSWIPKEHLAGGLEHFLCSHILGMSSSQLTNSYFSEGFFSIPPNRKTFGSTGPYKSFIIPSMTYYSRYYYC